MVSSVLSKSLTEKGKFPLSQEALPALDGRAAGSTRACCVPAEPFLRIPPFPGAKVQHFEPLSSGGVPSPELLQLLRRERVGGTFWAAQPKLPERYVLVRDEAALAAANRLFADRPVVLWDPDERTTQSGDSLLCVVRGDCDPWHVIGRALAVITEAGDELRAIAAVLGIERHVFDPNLGEARPDDTSAEALFTGLLPETVEDPFTGDPMPIDDAVRLCGFWRRLIDSNRGVSGGLGFAFWKQQHVAPLLWDGTDPPRFLKDASGIERGATVAAWRTKTSPEVLADLERRGIRVVEVEDGFLRSRGLGADCIPPLSITVDRLGAYFDPSGPSELERLLQDGKFDVDIVTRAAELRRLIVAAGLAKYEQGRVAVERPAGERRHILVPGQVEDDRAVQLGGCGLVSNVDLLARVRAEAPDAYILYKPHPDVVAGHRRGAVPDRICLQYADEIVGDVAVASLIDMVDEVHVNTSLAGFEALLRGKLVTTYGVPFYAGWGLTRDLGPVPSRRTARRTLDEMVAAVLLLYPRYLDPVTQLPCPAEVLVRRLTADREGASSLLVAMRRLQGRVMRRLRSLVE